MLTLYDAARCPFCARVRIVLAEKGIPYEPVEIDLGDRPEWIYEKNPLGKVPVLEDEGGLVLPESAVIMEYLEDGWPDPALWPADPAERALGRLWLDRFDDRLGRRYYAFRRGQDGAEDALRVALEGLEDALTRQPYLTGAAYGLADIGYLPWLVRLRDAMNVSLDAFPSLAGWLERLCDRPAVAAEVGLVAAL